MPASIPDPSSGTGPSSHWLIMTASPRVAALVQPHKHMFWIPGTPRASPPREQSGEWARWRRHMGFGCNAFNSFRCLTEVPYQNRKSARPPGPCLETRGPGPECGNSDAPIPQESAQGGLKSRISLPAASRKESIARHNDSSKGKQSPSVPSNKQHIIIRRNTLQNSSRSQ